MKQEEKIELSNSGIKHNIHDLKLDFRRDFKELKRDIKALDTRHESLLKH